MYRYSPATAAGPVASFVGALGLFGSIFPRWFSVLEKYPGDQVRNDYGILALDRGSLHSYVALGWVFEILTVSVAAVALLAAVYSSVAMDRGRPSAVPLVACGVVALAIVVVASITFDVVDSPSTGVIGSDLRLGSGAFIAATSAVVILVGGLLTLRRQPSG